MEKINLQEPQQPKFKKLKKETKVFQDAVHGTISIPYACKVVVDTPEFQRLRRLRQLGMAYMVYPSATHTRFEHSLGVCHLAGLLAANLKENQEELSIDEKDVLCVQLAGLCHDLGHGPLGHFWEGFARNKLKKEWIHEEMSVRMLDHMWEKNALKDSLKEVHDDDLAFIKAMIHPKGYPLPEKYRSKDFLLQIVSNEKTGIDVDKWDYFLRDSLHLGLKVTFDPKRFIEYSRVIEHKGEKFICFRDKMYREVLELFQTRCVLHLKAYKHKVLHCIDLMIMDALHAEMDYNEEFEQMVSKFEDPEVFMKLTDEMVQRLRESRSGDVKKIFHRIDTRKLYKCKDEKDDGNKCGENEVKIKN
ncbi:hypothetical protein O3P69_009348 [Scylla paramamosain]|uniref:HD domain-containing protein n=1 Tax=Scylla paramamosain TaxID=85552 RepID=A0AAW0TAZ2_SCYPA